MAKNTAPSRMEEAVHVVPNVSAAGALARCGACDFVVIQDRFCPGPCDVDPELHLQKRQEYRVAWAQGYSGPGAAGLTPFWTWMAGNLFGACGFNAKLSEYPPEKPIVLWTAPCWTDRLVYWWVLDALQRSPQEWKRFWVAEPPQPRGEACYFYHTQSQLGCTPLKEHQETFTALHRLVASEVEAGAALWRQFASTSALDFDRARRRRSRFFPDLRADAEVYGNLFPQAASRASVKLRLSAADQELLDRLRTNQWLCPSEIERAGARPSISCFSATGAYSRVQRLREWARHCPDDPAVIEGPGPDSSHEFNAVAYRLTQHGLRLRKHGLESAEEAPPMFVGGCLLYAGDPLWVRRQKGDGWVIEGITGRS